MANSDYANFLAQKLSSAPATGIPGARVEDEHLFPFQRDLVTWALRRGRAALFADTGLGKTRMQLTWAREVQRHTRGRVLILAPLSVAKQTAAEGAVCGIGVTRAFGASSEDGPGIYVTNYDKLHKFADVKYDAVVLDESSIIKHHDAKTLAVLLERFCDTPYKLCASATPSPNDYTELGTHAEFLGVCTRTEMLAEFFTHDGGDTSKWRLKGHARHAFWRWVSAWAALLRSPDDLGYDGANYRLPDLRVSEHRSDADPSVVRAAGLLFAEPASTLTERRNARRDTMPERIRACVETVMGCKCGIPNTTKQGESGPSRTTSTDSNETSNHAKLARQKNTRRTCEPTISQTSTVASLEPLRNESNTTPQGVQNTHLTPNSEATSNPRSGNTTMHAREPSSGSIYESSDLRSSSTTVFLPLKTDAAQSAAPIKGAIGESRGSMSITATGPESSEVSFAGDATSGSVNSTMIQSVSKAQRCTCDASEKWIVWVELNAEQEALRKEFGEECASITGSMTSFEKELIMDQFLRGEKRILLSKPRICGFGVNLQLACRMAFVGVTDSYESYYQATRRIWRFGQKRECHIHIFYNELEGDVLKNLQRKGEDARKMGDELSSETREMVQAQVRGAVRETNAYESRGWVMPGWLTRREADCE